MTRALPLAINLVAGLTVLSIGMARDDTPTWPGIVASAFSALSAAVWWFLEGRHTNNTSERR